MIGNNEFWLNQATMIEAVQMYLNAQMVKAPLVTCVQVIKDGFSEGFIIKTEDHPEAKS